MPAGFSPRWLGHQLRAPSRAGQCLVLREGKSGHGDRTRNRPRPTEIKAFYERMQSTWQRNADQYEFIDKVNDYLP
jgi:hypothetical protein